MDEKNKKLRNACEAALQAIAKTGNSHYAEIQSKLKFVIGSFDFDKNPIGLYEIGKKALGVLNEIKEKNPKKLAKKVITDLETSLKS